MAGQPSHKYNSQLAVIPNCPPGGCAPQQMTAYRFVYDPDPGRKSFLPQGIKRPQRMFEADTDHERCSLLAISMYVTAQKARRHFKNLAKKYDARTILGTHLASVSIAPTHGVVTTPSSRGHFDLHEFVGCNLAAVAQIVEKM